MAEVADRNESYGDSIDLKRTSLWKNPADTDRADLVFRRLNMYKLGMLLISGPEFNSRDSRKLNLDKLHPLCPYGTFLAMIPAQREQLR